MAGVQIMRRQKDISRVLRDKKSIPPPEKVCTDRKGKKRRQTQ